MGKQCVEIENIASISEEYNQRQEETIDEVKEQTAGSIDYYKKYLKYKKKYLKIKYIK